MTLKAVLFDLDGTLLDTAPDFVTVLNTLLIEEGRDTLADDIIRATVSSGARALVQLGFNLNEGETEFERLRLRLLELYSAHLADATGPFAGIEDTLHFLREQSIAWGIVTNKPQAYTEPLMQQITLPGTPPATVICPDHVTHRKPHPEPLLLACKHLTCTPAEAIYLGDHRRDIESGRNAGMPTIACGYGYIEQGDSIHDWQASHIIEHASEIPAVLQHYL